MIDRQDKPVYIFHTQQPPMLIEVHHEAIAMGEGRLHLTGNYQNTDGEIETITLTIEALLICEPEVLEEMKDRCEKVLKKAWHWYIAYLKWEDDNIDTDEQAQLN